MGFRIENHCSIAALVGALLFLTPWITFELPMNSKRQNNDPPILLMVVKLYVLNSMFNNQENYEHDKPLMIMKFSLCSERTGGLKGLKEAIYV